MENMDCTEQEKVGILFIYEYDGLEWTNYLMDILQANPYNIRCLSALCWDLNKEITERCSVLVLVFTPDMESKASSLCSRLLQPNSAHSCIVECNGEWSKTKMPKWNISYTLEETLESKRALLTRLIDLYEGATGNKDVVSVHTENVLIMDVIPAVLYPGQKEIYIIFNYEEQADVTVSVEGVTDRLSTRKCTKTVHVFDMPDTDSGKKNVNIYVDNQGDPIFSTSVVIITPENLTESLALNLRKILKPNSSQEPRIKKEASSFDPFSEPQCSDASLHKCWLTLKEYIGEEIKPAEKKPNDKHMDTKGEEVENKTEVYEENREPVMRRKSSKLNKIKTMFNKVFGNNSTGYEVNTNKRKSRRILMAKAHMLKGNPKLPQKSA